MPYDCERCQLKLTLDRVKLSPLYTYTCPSVSRSDGMHQTMFKRDKIGYESVYCVLTGYVLATRACGLDTR
jgi:hypothetical protein